MIELKTLPPSPAAALKAVPSLVVGGAEAVDFLSLAVPPERQAAAAGGNALPVPLAVVAALATVADVSGSAAAVVDAPAVLPDARAVVVPTLDPPLRAPARARAAPARSQTDWKPPEKDEPDSDVPLAVTDTTSETTPAKVRKKTAPVEPPVATPVVLIPPPVLPPLSLDRVERAIAAGYETAPGPAADPGMPVAAVPSDPVAPALADRSDAAATPVRMLEAAAADTSGTGTTGSTEKAPEAHNEATVPEAFRLPTTATAAVVIPGPAGPAAETLVPRDAAAAMVVSAASAAEATPSGKARRDPARPGRIVAAEAHAPLATPLAPVVSSPSGVQPAAVAFGAAMLAAVQADDARPLAPSPNDPPIAFTPLQDVVQANAVAQPVTTPATLDTRSDAWMQGMIDHIETVRDGQGAGDTRIRLMPDALGQVGVSIRSEGDTIHVHFTAASAETRGLLSDAQPRLAEIAGERGLKLGQSSVDSGSGETGRQPRQALPQTPAAPAAPVRVANDSDSTITETRIA